MTTTNEIPAQTGFEEDYGYRGSEFENDTTRNRRHIIGIFATFTVMAAALAVFSAGTWLVTVTASALAGASAAVTFAHLTA